MGYGITLNRERHHMSGLISLMVGRPKSTQIAGFQVQTAVYGRPIPIVYGLTRIAANLIHMPQIPALKSSGQSKATRSTKGAAGGEMYVAPMVLGLCEGPINGIGYVWRDKDGALAYVGNYDVAGWTLKTGTLAQAAWSYLTTNYPAQAVPYQLLAYVANDSTPLPSDSLSQYSWEIQGFLPFEGFGGGQIADSFPPSILNDFLTNATYGTGFSGAQIGSLTAMSNYCAAAGLFASLAIDENKPAADYANEMCEVGNTALVWSDGKLKFIPYGDVSLTGHGHTYTPNTTPLYDLTDTDFLPQSGDLDPIQVSRTDPATAVNQVTVEYRDRNHDYNITTYTAQDQYAIQQYGTIPLTLQLHSITAGDVAQAVAQMRLQREQNVRNTYGFRLGWRFSLLEPMDLVTLTDVGLGLSKTPVRLVSVTDPGDESGFDVVAEEWPFGTASTTLYATPNPAGTAPNANVDPGNTATPIITEAPSALKTSPLDLFIAASGGASWGGCDVYISTDNVNFQKVGRIVGAAAMGTLTATLNAGAAWPATDGVNTLSVDITASRRTLSSYSATDFANLVPSCYVGGEWCAFETATLTSPGHYNLTTLYRALYNTATASHGAGQSFFLLDSTVARIPWAQGKAGETIYFKLPAFNIYGAALQDVSAVSSVSYTIVNDPTSFANAAPQGTIAIAANGAWTASWDGPSGALSYKYIAQTSGYAADATVVGSGTIVNGRSQQTITSPGTNPLTFGSTIFITIVPFTAAGANGNQLPSIHIRGSYQTYTATKTTTYSRVGWQDLSGFGFTTDANNGVINPFLSAGTIRDRFCMSILLPVGVTLVSAAFDAIWNVATNPLGGFALSVWQNNTSINFGTPTYGGGLQTVTVSLGSTVTTTAALSFVNSWGAAFANADAAQAELGDVSITYSMPDPAKTV